MLLTVNGLQKHYKSRKQKRVTAVQSVSFTLPAGNILAFLGPNGAGKTTCIKMIAGLIRPDAGDAAVAGYSVTRQSRLALRHIGAVLEGSRNLYWRLTPIENFQYWGGLRGISAGVARTRGLALLEQFGLAEKATSTIQKLSRGMQQQVAICTALIHQPALLLLDEPTLGLDLQASDRIQALILKLAREQDIGILLTTHQMEVAEALSDRLSIIQNGRLTLEGDKQEVLQRFSGNTYIFELSAPIAEGQKSLLIARGAEFERPTKFRISCAHAVDPYDILSTLKPLPIVKVERATADFAAVFRQVTQEAYGQAPAVPEPASDPVVPAHSGASTQEVDA